MPAIAVVIKTRPRPDDIYALVDPPTQIVVIEGSLAQGRGLRAFIEKRQKECHPDVRFGPWLFDTTHNREFKRTRHGGGTRFLIIRFKIASSERQTAKLSTNHDGDYAVAVCIAADQLYFVGS